MIRIREFKFDRDIEKITPLDRYIMGDRPEKTVRAYYKNYNGETFVAQDGKELLGYVSLSFPHWNGIAYIDHLAVLETKRNRGIGRMLVKKVMKLAKIKGARFMAVPTALWNIKGINFYKREGFQLRAVLPDWIGVRNDLVWLDKRLKSGR